MENQANKSHLSIPEAVLLGHALVSRVADSVGIRAFFIKGPATVIHGLRLPRTSADVDVFVSPEDLEAMLSGLRERGWRERPVDPDNTTFPKHSVTVDHPEWPCCIDIHFRFPGMEKAPNDCFDVMWANTEELEIAGQEVRVPSKALGTVILALHALRSPHLPACRQELEFLADLTEQQSAVHAILDISAATGSLAAMRPFLEDLLPATAGGGVAGCIRRVAKPCDGQGAGERPADRDCPGPSAGEAQDAVPRGLPCSGSASVS